MITAVILILLAVTLSLWLAQRQAAYAKLEDRLATIATAAEDTDVATLPINWRQTEKVISHLHGRYGQAGLLTLTSQGQAQIASYGLFSALFLLGLIVGYQKFSLWGALGGAVLALYLAFTIWLAVLQTCTRHFHRRILFQIPLFLEDIILLVEAGLGVLPAIEKVVSAPDGKTNQVKTIFAMVYQLAAHGLPFGKALELIADQIDVKVLRHVLMHMDIANSEGGELIPSLRALSDHAHSEWRLAVEARVKKLENMVVFPVFFAVIGLMLLVAAVPMVPLLNLKDSLKTNGALVRAQFSSAAHENSIKGGNFPR